MPDVRGCLIFRVNQIKDNKNENYIIRDCSHGGVVYGIVRS